MSLSISSLTRSCCKTGTFNAHGNGCLHPQRYRTSLNKRLRGFRQTVYFDATKTMVLLPPSATVRRTARPWDPRTRAGIAGTSKRLNQCCLRVGGTRRRAWPYPCLRCEEFLITEGAGRG